MAGEALYIPILLGLELDSLSMNPLAIPRVKKIIRSASLEECKIYLREVLDLPTAAEITDSLRRIAWHRFREDFEIFGQELGVLPALSGAPP
jgi:phosphotransferase system enzyme I (PtsI)